MDKTLQELHDKIDADYDARRSKLDEDREKDHAALDRIWPMLASQGLPQTQPNLIPDLPSNGHSGSGLFPMMPAIEKIFRAYPDTEISQRTLFDGLIAKYPELRERDPGHLRAQISSTLNKMTERGMIRLVRRGSGGNPHIYKSVVILQPEEAIKELGL